MLSRKKARRIVVDETEYFWVASGNDGWIDLFVERDVQRSPKLTFMFPYGGEHGQRQVSVTPHVVRRAILYALEKGWTPSEPGKDLRFGLDEHTLDIREARIDRFYRIYEKLKPELDPDFDSLRKYGEVFLDLEIIADRLWSLNPGDEFWEALIDTLKLDFGFDTTQMESRLTRAHAVELIVPDGCICAYLSKAGGVHAWGHNVYAIESTVRLGARDSRRLARGLRDLSARSSDEGPSDTSFAGWLPLAGTNWVEMPRSGGLIRLDREAMSELASALERASQNAPRDSPPRDFPPREPGDSSSHA